MSITSLTVGGFNQLSVARKIELNCQGMLKND